MHNITTCCKAQAQRTQSNNKQSKKKPFARPTPTVENKPTAFCKASANKPRQPRHADTDINTKMAIRLPWNKQQPFSRHCLLQGTNTRVFCKALTKEPPVARHKLNARKATISRVKRSLLQSQHQQWKTNQQPCARPAPTVKKQTNNNHADTHMT